MKGRSTVALPNWSAVTLQNSAAGATQAKASSKSMLMQLEHFKTVIDAAHSEVSFRSLHTEAEDDSGTKSFTCPMKDRMQVWLWRLEDMQRCPEILKTIGSLEDENDHVETDFVLNNLMPRASPENDDGLDIAVV